MEKRFIYGKASDWNANKSGNETKFANSIVFIKNDANDKKGDAIFAQGAYFEMNNTTDVENIIKNFLNGKGTGNINVVVDENGNLTISETSIASLTGKKDSAELVQAKAVTAALTTPVSLTLSVADGVGTFSEIFSTLNGDTTEAVTAVFESGDNVTLTKGTKGLKISATDTTYTAGTGLTLAEGNVFNHTNNIAANTETKSDVTLGGDVKTFDFDQYSYDKEGHITGKVTNVVTLPDTAFSDTTYTADKGITITNKNVIEHTNSVTAKTTAGGETVTLSATDTDFKYDQFTYDAQGHITGVTERTITLPETAFKNDNTTYTGENAIDVAQPETGSTQGKVTLKIDSTDKVLTQSASGLKTNLEIDYVSSTNKIRLTNGTDMISEFDASVFVKDSLLKDVEIVEENAEGTKGNYLKFTFETIDTDGTGESVDSTKVIYVDIKDFYVKTTVSKDDDTYTSVTKTGDDYKVSNVLGTISRNNDSNVITVSKDGLATVADIKTVLETIDSDLDAVKATGADKDEIAVVTGITQTDGKITAVDSGLAATKAYVDGKFGEVKHNTVSAPKAEGEENYATVTAKDNADGSKDYEVVVSGVDAAIAAATTTGTIVNQGANGTYNFVKTKDGLMTAADVAALMNESWEWGTIVTA